MLYASWATLLKDHTHTHRHTHSFCCETTDHLYYIGKPYKRNPLKNVTSKSSGKTHHTAAGQCGVNFNDRVVNCVEIDGNKHICLSVVY